MSTYEFSSQEFGPDATLADLRAGEARVLNPDMLRGKEYKRYVDEKMQSGNKSFWVDMCRYHEGRTTVPVLEAGEVLFAYTVNGETAPLLVDGTLNINDTYTYRFRGVSNGPWRAGTFRSVVEAMDVIESIADNEYTLATDTINV